MAEFETEEQQVEALKAWVAQNYKAILLGVGIGLGGIFGWRYYQEAQVSQAREAAALVHQMQQLAPEDMEQRTLLNERLREQYSGTPYPEFAALLMAKAQVEQRGDLAAAASELQWVLDNSDDEATLALVRLRLGRVQLAAGELEAVQTLVEASYPSAFAAMHDELRGDLALAQGDQQAAYEAYQQAQRSQLPVLSSEAILSMKVNDLTPAPSSSAAASERGDG